MTTLLVLLLWFLATPVSAQTPCEKILVFDPVTLASVLACPPRSVKETIQDCLVAGGAPVVCLQQAKDRSVGPPWVCETMNDGKRYCIENGRVIEVRP